MAVWVASVADKVPDVVTGEFDTTNIAGSDKPTDVTVPDVSDKVTYSSPDPAELTFKYWFAAPLFNTVQVVPSKYNKSPTAPVGKEKDPILGFLIKRLFFGYVPDNVPDTAMLVAPVVTFAVTVSSSNAPVIGLRIANVSPAYKSPATIASAVGMVVIGPGLSASASVVVRLNGLKSVPGGFATIS